MKLYLTASLIALGAHAYIAANEPPARAAAIAVAAVGWPDDTAAMARRTGPRWLLRAMPAAEPRGTLATLPDDGLVKAQPLQRPPRRSPDSRPSTQPCETRA